MQISLMHASAFSIVMLSSSACSVVKVVEPDFSPAKPEVVITNETDTGSIYKVSTNRFFFEDIRARRVGDVINVILDEQTDASKTASTSANKGTTIGLPSPSLFGGAVTIGGREILANDISASSDFSGSGDSSQSNQLSGSIAVVVEEVLSNGNMRIRGQKQLTLNQGSEIVRVAGLIRPVDITPQNTVQSNKIADANITYGGSGLLADANKAGWITRFLTGSIWPF